MNAFKCLKIVKLFRKHQCFAQSACNGVFDGYFCAYGRNSGEYDTFGFNGQLGEKDPSNCNAIVNFVPIDFLIIGDGAFRAHEHVEVLHVLRARLARPICSSYVSTDHT